MNPPAPVRHVLIDFENVPGTTLEAIDGLGIEVTLLVGEKNRRFDIALVEQLLAGGSLVHFIRVGASGRNALDLTLAYYLGRAAIESPGTEFFIVSGDGDYDAMIAHVRRHGVRVSRHASIEDLPFAFHAHLPPAEVRMSPEDARLAAFVDSLRRNEKHRPARLKTLRSHLQSHFGKNLSEAEVDRHLQTLNTAGLIQISDKGAVTYRL